MEYCGILVFGDARNLLIFGAGDGVRTRDVQLGKLAFFQLNYSRSASVLNIARTVVCELARNRPAWESEILALTVVFLHLPTRYSTRTRQVG